MGSIKLLLIIFLVTSCASTKIHKSYDHFLGETKVESGVILFPGLFESTRLQFIEIRNIKNLKNKEYHLRFTASSASGNTASSGSKIVFLVNNKDRIILNSKNANKTCLPTGFTTTCTSSCAAKIKRDQINKIAYGSDVKIRLYFKNKGEDLTLKNTDKHIIKEFLAETK